MATGDDRTDERIRRAASIGALLLPIVALKAGRTGAGRRAASSHTATMEAGELAVEALFHQAVVIRAGTLEEMFEHRRGGVAAAGARGDGGSRC